MRLAIRPDFEPGVRTGIVLAAVLTVLSATSARADEWCGYATHEDAVIECGYTTASDCESAVGKGGMCFVDPDVAMIGRRILLRRLFTPAVAPKVPPRNS
jgi:hypothetical protein